MTQAIQADTSTNLFKAKVEALKKQFESVYLQLNEIFLTQARPVAEKHKGFVEEAFWLYSVFEKEIYTDDSYCGLHELGQAMAAYLEDKIPDQTTLAKAQAWQEYIVFDAKFKRIYR